MAVALYARVSPPRQQPQQTLAHHLRRLRDDGATPPDWHVADEPISRDAGESGATLTRPGLDRLRDRAAMAAFAWVVITAPDRVARHSVHQLRLVDARTPRGCRVACVERPMRDAPPITSCCPCARPWRSRSARGLPSGGDGGAKRNDEAGHGCRGRERPSA